MIMKKKQLIIIKSLIIGQKNFLKKTKVKKGGKNLFLNDSLKGSKKNKNNEYLETENTTTDATLEKEKNVTEFLQRAQKMKYKEYN